MFVVNGIVIFIGLLGCGKIMVVIYLLGKGQYDWMFRKICDLEELLYIEKDKKFLILIDNIFFC